MIITKKRIFWFLAGMILIILTACNDTLENNIGEASSTASPDTTEISTTYPTPTFPPLEPTFAARIEELRSPDVPKLPFADNPDPALCGIPTTWNSNDPAWLTGYYEGELIEPIVHLYDSHMRLNIAAEAPHGTQVKVLLYQSNPYLDYYLVKVEGAEQPNEGWVPSPFLSFEKVSTEVDVGDS